MSAENASSASTTAVVPPGFTIDKEDSCTIDSGNGSIVCEIFSRYAGRRTVEKIAASPERARSAYSAGTGKPFVKNSFSDLPEPPLHRREYRYKDIVTLAAFPLIGRGFVQLGTAAF